jgi:hypothetical protein
LSDRPMPIMSGAMTRAFGLTIGTILRQP